MKASRPTSAWCSAMLIVTAFLAVSPSQAGETERRFFWQQANAAMCSARTKEDFLKAATVYHELSTAGAANGALYLNMGTALLQAGQYDVAISSLLRAERHMGSTPEIRRNLLLAIRGKTGDSSSSLPWYRVPFFWHFLPSTNFRLWTAIVSWLALWTGAIVFVVGQRQTGMRIIRVSAVVLVLAASSVWTSFHEERVASASEAAFFRERAALGTSTPQQGVIN